MFCPLSTSKAVNLSSAKKNEVYTSSPHSRRSISPKKSKNERQRQILEQKTLDQLKKMYEDLFESYKNALDEQKNLQEERFAVIDSINNIRKETSSIEESIHRASSTNSTMSMTYFGSLV